MMSYNCPVDDWACPYYNEGFCKLDNPWLYCDDFIDFLRDENEEEEEKNKNENY